MWADKAVFYQIYPLGFTGAPMPNDGVCVNRIQKVKGVDSAPEKAAYRRGVFFPGV